MVTLPSFLLALLASGSGISAKATDICYRYDANGCSIPFDLYFFYKKCFTPSCNRHDICYSCGVAYNITRATCDWSFRRDMINTCRREFMPASVETDTLASEDKLHTILRKKNVLSILDNRVEDFQSILEKLIPSYINLCDKLGKLKGTYAFTHHYTDHVVIQWAVLLARDLELEGNSVQGNRLLSHFQSVMFRKEDVVSSISARQINTNNKRLDTFLFKQAKEGVTQFKHKFADFAIWDCNSSDTSFCKQIQNNLFSSRNLYDLTVELQCDEINLLLCLFISEVYYIAVHLFGSFRFDHEPKIYCNESFVPQCLPPRDNLSMIL
ncbi:hypothetical protein BsWGS_22883 [Bradybaena similaris]